MFCPICEADLVPDTHEGVEVERCPEDHGLWLDSGELRTLADSLAEARPADEKAAALLHGGSSDTGDPTAGEERICPNCREPLERVEYDEYSGVYIDSCLEDGVWLDTSELERVEAWIEANKEELAPVRARIDAGLKREEQMAAAVADSPIRTFFTGVALTRDS